MDKPVSVKLLTSVRPKGADSSRAAAAAGPHPQEEAGSHHWYLASSLWEEAGRRGAGTGITPPPITPADQYQKEISDSASETHIFIS